MKSPFPGMDPYIEACDLWEGFHGHLIEGMYRTISRALPPGYTADTGIRSYIVLLDSNGKDDHSSKPDITVTESASAKKPHKRKGNAAVAEPTNDTESVAMKAYVSEQFEETFIEIYAGRKDRYLVTCIEVLSPSNKRRGTKGWLQYERKRQALLLGEANFIEIDLLRGGEKMPMHDDWPNSPYSLLVCRAMFAPNCRVWPASFQRRLPVIPVPLSDPDPDLKLDLQPLIDDIYEVGRYNELVDYTQPLSPKLSKEDAAWMRKLLKKQTPSSGGKGRSSRSQ